MKDIGFVRAIGISEKMKTSPYNVNIQKRFSGFTISETHKADYSKIKDALKLINWKAV